MTPADAARVLAKAAAFDQRTIGETDALAWAEALDDVPVCDALAAVTRWYREHRDRAMPSDIRHLAADVARTRRRENLEHEHRQLLAAEAAQAQPSRRGRGAEVDTLIHELRDSLPVGDPNKLRRPEWVEHDRRQHHRATTARPNPHYDPTVHKRLADETP